LTLNQGISAMRFFHNEVLHREWPLEIHQRAPRRVPVTLSPEEVTRLLRAVPGVREREAMEIAYAAGLRLSEMLHLKLSDFDSERMILRVEQGKGKKGRAGPPNKRLKLTSARWQDGRAHSLSAVLGGPSGANDGGHRDRW
jgi:integrase/recombinase XerD